MFRQPFMPPPRLPWGRIFHKSGPAETTVVAFKPPSPKPLPLPSINGAYAPQLGLHITARPPVVKVGPMPPSLVRPHPAPPPTAPSHPVVFPPLTIPPPGALRPIVPPLRPPAAPPHQLSGGPIHRQPVTLPPRFPNRGFHPTLIRPLVRPSTPRYAPRLPYVPPQTRHHSGRHEEPPSVSNAQDRSPSVNTSMAWGKMVSPEFKSKVLKIAADLGTDPNYLMAVMAFESGGTFSPSVRNKLSGARGLIQIMPKFANAVGTRDQELATMTPERQLDYVAKWFHMQAKGRPLTTLEDVYMAVFSPVAIGKPASFVCYRSPSPNYKQNAGLDTDRDGQITKFEAAAQVRRMLLRGLRPDKSG